MGTNEKLAVAFAGYTAFSAMMMTIMAVLLKRMNHDEDERTLQ